MSYDMPAIMISQDIWAEKREYAPGYPESTSLHMTAVTSSGKPSGQSASRESKHWRQFSAR